MGRGVAKTLAAFGATVAIWERDPETCEAAAAEFGGLGITVDVRESEQVDAALARTRDKPARSRSSSTTPAACSPSPSSKARRRAGMPSTGPISSTSSCARTGWPRPWSQAELPGSIISVTSIEGVRAAPGYAAYAAAKAGVINFTKTIALELATHGIRVNALAPTSP